MPSVDTVFWNMQNCLTGWSAALQCSRCASNNDQEVFMLTVMCIRCALSQLGEVSFQLRRKTKPNPGADRRQRGAECSASWLSIPDEVPLQLGGFRVTGYDRSILLRVLLTVTLRRIEAVVDLLRVLLQRKRKLQSSGDTLDYMGHMADDLAASVKALLQ